MPQTGAKALENVIVKWLLRCCTCVQQGVCASCSAPHHPYQGCSQKTFIFEQPTKVISTREGTAVPEDEDYRSALESSHLVQSLDVLQQVTGCVLLCDGGLECVGACPIAGMADQCKQA